MLRNSQEQGQAAIMEYLMEEVSPQVDTTNLSPNDDEIS